MNVLLIFLHITDWLGLCTDGQRGGQRNPVVDFLDCKNSLWRQQQKQWKNHSWVLKIDIMSTDVKKVNMSTDDRQFISSYPLNFLTCHRYIASTTSNILQQEILCIIIFLNTVAESYPLPTDLFLFTLITDLCCICCFQSSLAAPWILLAATKALPVYTRPTQWCVTCSFQVCHDNSGNKLAVQ